MMGIFDWLTGKDIVPNKNCTFESYGSDRKLGKWVYTCKVKCPKYVVHQIVRCFVEDTETKPIYRCSCGETIELFSAPYKVYMGNDKSKFHYTGNMLRLSTGRFGGHTVTIDEVIECEQDW